MSTGDATDGWGRATYETTAVSAEGWCQTVLAELAEGVLSREGWGATSMTGGGEAGATTVAGVMFGERPRDGLMVAAATVKARRALGSRYGYLRGRTRRGLDCRGIRWSGVWNHCQ